MQIRRGDVVVIRLDPGVGSEQQKTRPAVVVQNDVGNRYAPTTIIVPLTSQTAQIYPTDVLISKDSKALCSQILTVDKTRIVAKKKAVTPQQLMRIDKALKLSLSLS